ncbi:MAG: SpoIID/LytB domain-containing protein, partial [Acidimicrobiia bacterium]
VEVIGHGYGHGRGMGQYGSLGYALSTPPWSYERILDHYYGGTRMGNLQNLGVTVHLTRFDQRDVIVAQDRGLMTTTAVPGQFSALRAVWEGQNRYGLYQGAGCGGGPGGWQFLGDVSGPITFQPVLRNDNRDDMLKACEPSPGGKHRWLRGDVLALEGGGVPRAVNRLDIDAYLKGVVPRESPASWGVLGGGAGMQALRAQAVAARSYASAERRSDWAQTCDTTSCQVYGGHAEANADGSGFKPLEAATTNDAVDQTRGQIRVDADTGKVARTEFSSSTGGWTAGGTFPAVVDAGDSVDLNPSSTWRASVPVEVIEAAHPEIGTLLAVDVTERNGLGAMGGRVGQLRLRGTDGRATLSGEDFRFLYPYSSALRPAGLRSDWFQVLNNPSGGVSGYWVGAPDGGVFAFGDAGFFGSMGGTVLNRPVVGMAPTPSGGGYWLVASDGGIFTFGDAGFFGSMGGTVLNQPMAGMASTPEGGGYWLVAEDGGVFTFGDAGYHGGLPDEGLPGPARALRGTRTGDGYLVVTAAGDVSSFGDAPSLGSVGEVAPDYAGGVVGLGTKAAPEAPGLE